MVIQNYQEIYPELEKSKQNILSIIEEEEIKFEKTLDRGLL